MSWHKQTNKQTKQNTTQGRKTKRMSNTDPT